MQQVHDLLAASAARLRERQERWEMKKKTAQETQHKKGRASRL
jgi:hypothetical protein